MSKREEPLGLTECVRVWIAKARAAGYVCRGLVLLAATDGVATTGSVSL